MDIHNDKIFGNIRYIIQDKSKKYPSIENIEAYLKANVSNDVTFLQNEFSFATYNYKEKTIYFETKTVEKENPKKMLLLPGKNNSDMIDVKFIYQGDNKKINSFEEEYRTLKYEIDNARTLCGYKEGIQRAYEGILCSKEQSNEDIQNITMLIMMSLRTIQSIDANLTYMVDEFKTVNNPSPRGKMLSNYFSVLSEHIDFEKIEKGNLEENDYNPIQWSIASAIFYLESIGYDSIKCIKAFIEKIKQDKLHDTGGTGVLEYTDVNFESCKTNVEESETNIVKLACKELGITQKELAERLEVSKPSVDRWASTGEIPDSSKKLIEFLVENKKLKNELLELKQALIILHKHTL